MDRLHELPPRSASMPSPGTELPVGRFQPFARKSISRRDSEMVLSEGPITPPESPGPEDMSLNQGPQPPLEIVMEQTQAHVTHVDYPATPVSQTPDDMDEDSVPFRQAAEDALRYDYQIPFHL